MKSLCKQLLSLGMMSSSCLLAHPPISLESDKMDYSKAGLELHGHVLVEHSLVRISAQELVFRPLEDGSTCFEYRNQVQFCFSEGGTLDCDYASLNPRHSKGHFKSLSSVKPVVYHHLDKEGMEFTLLCDQMDLYLPTDSSFFTLNDIWSCLPKESHLRCSGPIQIRLRQSSEAKERLLTCQGELLIQAALSRIDLQSPLIDGAVPLNQQVVYEDELGIVRADAMTIDYTLSGTQLLFNTLLMHKNIQLQSKPSMPTHLSSLQFALADELEYQIQNEIVILKAFEGNKVLFLDQQQDTKMSCQQLVINRLKKSVEGWGNVHLSLNAQELTQLYHQWGAKDGK